MRLQSDPHSIIYDTAAQVVSTINSFVPTLTDAARGTIHDAIIAYCDNDVERVDHALLYARMVYRETKTEGFNPVAALMYGMTPPTDDSGSNLFKFVSQMSGDDITDIRTVGLAKVEMALNIRDTIPEYELSQFTPDKHEGARQLLYGLAHVIAESTGVEGKFLQGQGDRRTLEVPSPTVMVASGILPTLIQVVNDMDGMEHMPGELLITLYHDDLVGALPDAGVYHEYAKKLSDAAVMAS